MVPGLLVTEVRRRKEYQSKAPPDGGSASTEEAAAAASVEPEEVEDLCVLSVDDAVSLSLEYYKRYVEASSDFGRQVSIL